MTIWPSKLILVLVLAASQAYADHSKDIGDAVVHYNAVRTDFFDPQIAKLYGIKRSRNRGLLTITVLKKHMGLASLPVKASITASAVNLSNQVKAFTMREVTDGGAIYYVGEFPVTDNETLDFKINVEPAGGKPERVEFRQTFFVD